MAEKGPTIPGKKAYMYMACVIFVTVLVTAGAVLLALAARPPKVVYVSRLRRSSAP